MDKFLVACPHCQSKLEADESMSGVRVACPICDKSFVVRPPQDESAPVEAADIRDGMKLTSTLSAQANLPVKRSTKLPICALILSCCALLASIVALVFTLIDYKPFAVGIRMPCLELSKTPEATVKNTLTFQNQLNSTMGSYFARTKGAEALKSLTIKEIKTSGNFAVAFYTLTLGATEVKETMFLYRTNDGYWIRLSNYVAKKKCPDKWFADMQDKIKKFTKDSGEFDETDF